MRPAQDDAGNHDEPTRDLDGRHPLAEEGNREEDTPAGVTRAMSDERASPPEPTGRTAPGRPVRVAAVPEP
jgi:hypothetical protein